MQNKKSVNLIFLIIATIVGVTLFKQFDFETLKFRQTGIAIVYIITFVFSIYYLVKNYNKRPEK